MQNFLDLFVDYNRDFESPRSFWWWSGAALVGSVMRNNVYFNMGNDILYPNIYVLLLADSAVFRKGGPFPLVTELANDLHHTKVYDGRASIQAILEKLSQDIGGKKGIPIRGGSCLLLAEELASFFVADPQLIPLITNVYRSRKLFTYDLRGNAFTVKDLCVTMLSASNEIHLRDVYDERAVYGGLLGRTFLIKPDERRPENSLLDLDLTKYNKKVLLDPLEEIKKLTGSVTFEDAAKRIYKSWYKELYASLTRVPDPAGILGRIHTSVLKLSIIVAACDYTLTVTADHMEVAIKQSIALKPNYETYVMASGKSSQATIGAMFLAALWDATHLNGNKLPRKQFLMNHWNQVSAEDFDKLIITLEQSGMIKTDLGGNEIGYIMTEHCKKLFEQKKTNLGSKMVN